MSVSQGRGEGHPSTDLTPILIFISGGKNKRRGTLLMNVFNVIISHAAVTSSTQDPGTTPLL